MNSGDAAVDLERKSLSSACERVPVRGLFKLKTKIVSIKEPEVIQRRRLTTLMKIHIQLQEDYEWCILQKTRA
ncbi:unnamed protein product [Pleuronectes platessa]|uniref:Uncharacterized protein n=1 Tax=Pleuronectes platessa TaxID=8262 RepID=A0A9N7YDW0_PLEPL|nr:unnamed protein product [Pleuronectes platessa]